MQNNSSLPKDVLRELAIAVLLIYNNWKQAGRIAKKESNNFFEAIESVYEEKQLSTQISKEEFKKIIIPECQHIQPPKRSCSSKKRFEEDKQLGIEWLQSNTGNKLSIEDAIEFMEDIAGSFYVHNVLHF